MRHLCLVRLADLQSISIHAPLAGCDVTDRIRRTKNAIFQSTHPLRGATVDTSGRLVAVHGRFQSTHPLWGATTAKKSCNLIIRFQSTHPLWGATRGHGMITIDQFGFQSTHPLWGATRARAGGSGRVAHFNPRTPCGVRRESPMSDALVIAIFQSTHPLRGATGK